MTPHLDANEIELWSEGLLPAARAMHLADCEECFATAERERKFSRELAQLQRFAPSDGFADKVLGQVKIPTPSGEFGRE
jgi:hypothetical protein